MAALTWAHTDSDAIPSLRAALDIAKKGAWGTIDAETRARYLRSLMVITLQMGHLRRAAPRPRGPEGPIEYGHYGPDLYSDQEHLETASTVLRTPQLILPRGAYPTASIETTDGAPAVAQGDKQTVDVGAVPLLVWVVGIAACAVASIVVAQTTGEVIDRQLVRSEDTKRLLATQARAVEVLAAHTKREEEKGQTLPLTDAEKEVLAGLFQVQQTIVEKRETPLPSPFAGAAKTFGEMGESIGKGVEMALPIVAALGIGYFVLK